VNVCLLVSNLNEISKMSRLPSLKKFIRTLMIFNTTKKHNCVARFKVCGVKYILVAQGTRFFIFIIFIICLKHIFLGTTKFGRHCPP